MGVTSLVRVPFAERMGRLSFESRGRRGYKTTVKTAKATMMPVAMMPILRISKGKVRA